VGGDVPRGQWLTRCAFVLAVGLVVARVTMLETLRDPFAVTLGAQPIPRGAGAAAGVVMDALAWLPALLVLLRRVIDPTYRLRPAWSQLWLALLAAWGMASFFWSADRFASAVGAFHFASAAVLFLAASQAVRTWARLRLVAAITFGLLLTFAVQGYYYRYVDLPDLQRSFEQNKESILQERGWTPGSFEAEQFSRKITGGEMMGFDASPNTFAAIIVLASIVTLGVGVQRLVDRDGAAWAAGYAAAFALAAVIVWFTHSKAAVAALAIGTAAVLALWAIPGLRRWLGRHARLGYAAGVAAVLLAIAAVVGHGLYHGGLPSDSLNFRWRYWVGSARMFERHPLLGVGWNNFGANYLATRLQAAAEEIKDPHDFLLRFALELGAIGGALAVGWLLWLWWDLTRPVLPAADDSPLRLWVERGRNSPIARVAMIAALGMGINVLASVDLTEVPAYVIVELFKRGLFFCVLVIGGALVALKRLDQAEADGRFAGWILHAMLVGLGLFLVQCLIDVAFFEVGPMYLFFLLAGSALGMRLRENAERPRRSAAAAAALAGAGAAWVAAIVLLVTPVVRGEATAGWGDDAMRARRPADATRLYGDAYAAVPWDAEYAFRAARAAMAAGNPDAAKAWLDRAIATDPTAAEYYLTRASLELSHAPPDVEAVRRDYTAALDLNPNDVGGRLAYADLLARLGLKQEARQQYRVALEKNQQYDVTEPKRLPPAEADRIKGVIQSLE
jgi:O-antigen ligase/tetratricopeptide (TPR) repeat protein